MRKLTPEELADLAVSGQGRASSFYLGIIGLKKGEGGFISKKEWNLGKTPGRICRYIMKKFPHVKYTCGLKPDNTGWIVKRVE